MVTVFSKFNLIANRLSLYMIKKNLLHHQQTIMFKKKSQRKSRTIMNLTANSKLPYMKTLTNKLKKKKWKRSRKLLRKLKKKCIVSQQRYKLKLNLLKPPRNQKRLAF